MVDVKLDYESAQRMAAGLKEGAIRLNDMRAIMLKIADMLDDGALVNQQGERWSNALRSTVSAAITRGEERLQEVSDDVLKAIAELSNTDSEQAGSF